MNSDPLIKVQFLLKELKNYPARPFSLLCTIFRINPLEYREGLEQRVTVIQRSNQPEERSCGAQLRLERYLRVHKWFLKCAVRKIIADFVGL